ncbi:DUF6538 domain-containing protein [Celeribacter arenosi]|uniref:Uncharacterized protein n=1 Tax=Celeribacter arenosi TaxID=792649 RepID=A0ABP7K497_9RHOB
MTLKMPNPIKNKKSGIFSIRVRVPADLVTAFGRSEYVKSLRTRDPAEAKVRFAAEYASFQKRCSALRAKPQVLPFKKIMILAGRAYHELMEILENEPGEPEIWEGVKRLNAKARLSDAHRDKWYGPYVDKLLEEEGIAVDARSWERLIVEVQKAHEQAAEQQHKRSLGDFSPDPNADRFPKDLGETVPDASASGVTLTAVFDHWAKDHLANGKSHNTVTDFGRKIDALKAYVGHEDLDRLTPKIITQWCDHLRLEKELTSKTVAGKYLAAVRTVCRHAKSKFLITEDPTEGVKYKISTRVQTRPKGYTDDEAARILRCASQVTLGASKASYHNTMARRWVPWICAYTGARVGEITQLRAQDLTFENDIPRLMITPEAGTVKSGRYRFVPVHPHLQEVGLLEFIQSAEDDYLFHPGARTKEEAVKRAANARDKVGVWVRNSVGIDDKRIQPNHAWRHRFKTEGRNAGISTEYLGAIQGHVTANAAESYGEYSTEALYREICKLPRIAVG